MFKFSNITKKVIEYQTSRPKIKGRIHRQIAIIIIACISVTVAVCWSLNTWLLGDFYLERKEASMKEVYELIDNEAELGSLYTGEFALQLQRINVNKSLTSIVVRADGRVLVSTSSDTEGLVLQLQNTIFNTENQEILEINRDYVIEKQMDTRMNEEYLVLWGTLSDGNLLMIRSPLEGINDSVELSNQFMLYVGIVVIIIGIIAAAIIGRRFTKHIRELTELSKRMSELDFRAKYVPGRYSNEIDELGVNFNEMSDTLEKTIYTMKQDIDLLEKSEKTRTDFISAVSHELKTPIALIKGYAEGLQEGIMDDEESRNAYLEVILDESDRMSRLVKELLTLNQLEDSTGSNADIDEVDITEMILGVIDNHRIMIEQQEVNLFFDYEDDNHVVVLTDEFLIEQVINNYFSNALHYVAGEDNVIRVNCDIIENDVRVSVFNSGSYIPKEDITRIWDKFYKVDKARTREYEGSGIGLSIVKAVVERLGGEYGVINHDDGVEFYFVLKDSLKSN